MDQIYRIFTDGSAISNPGPGGWGVVVIQGKERLEMSGAHSTDSSKRSKFRLSQKVRQRKIWLPGSSNSARRMARRSTGSAALYELWKPESSIAGTSLHGLLTGPVPQPAKWSAPKTWCSTTC